ncbi:hypothetical protein like AT1G05270 [Hibiscus trionum]|uniref:TraB family protein n=1 Tax=Hibiscus trionum TaxID=183268 RepID=A0A9W7J1P4_HIBTR|nr:hypothetical protein like AT1G05270 [Hibiscus trionum]
MNRLTRPLNSVSLPELLRSLSLHASITKLRFSQSQAIRPLPYGKHFTPSKPLDFSTFASTANRPSFQPELPAIDPKPAELDPPSVENFIHVENPNPNPNVVEASSDHNNVDDVSRSKSSDSSERRNVDLPEELSKNVVYLSCESSAEGGKCDVYLVGTSHVSKESCREVEAIISYLKPQVVFLELCSRRVGVFTIRNVKDLKVPSEEEMVDMWRKNTHSLFEILYKRCLLEVGRLLEVVPGSEFRVAYEEASKCGAKVILGDRPIHITWRRFSGKMTLWQIVKLLYVLCSLPVAWRRTSTEDLCRLLKKTHDVDTVTRWTQGLEKKFPTLFETLVDERDRYMSFELLKVARRHSSVVAVVGKGHLTGIRKYWKKSVLVNELMAIPPRKPTLSTGKILASLGIVAIASGIYLASKM